MQSFNPIVFRGVEQEYEVYFWGSASEIDFFPDFLE